MRLPAENRSSEGLTKGIAKWCGAGFCVVTLLATASSVFWTIRCTSANHSVTLSRGAVEHLWRPPAVRDYIAPLCEFQSLKSEWERNRCNQIRWVCGLEDYEGVCWTIIPLWIPLCAAIPPTLWLWLRRRHHKEGHCRSCGYDLTGNLSGRCPECGTLLTQRSC